MPTTSITLFSWLFSFSLCLHAIYSSWCRFCTFLFVCLNLNHFEFLSQLHSWAKDHRRVICRSIFASDCFLWDIFVIITFIPMVHALLIHGYHLNSFFCFERCLFVIAADKFRSLISNLFFYLLFFSLLHNICPL